ncbi:MAG: ribosome maturation factor RimP [Pyrinomonadaceae bacterium]|nr:ribosome maturation factor RimP [Pyrinomonadaceae bacterium]
MRFGVGDTSLIEKLRKLAAKASEASGLELVHVEIAGSKNNQIVRIYIDKPDGVVHEDCSAVSTLVGDEIEEQDLIASAYTLEVSSPGIERGLYRLEDFERFSDSLAKVKTFSPINGQRKFRGRIVGVEAGEIVFDDKTNGVVRFPYSNVAKAKLEIDIEEEIRRANLGKS